ncbi:hypothetical protein [Caldilinea aerophila]|uniref:hypothetical protein n=1 Tax=Caldilinea aerophila TaxID=133453 RepID=UPI0013966ECB|nr:hypothetical protein [Caldilinea aerophila]
MPAPPRIPLHRPKSSAGVPHSLDRSSGVHRERAATSRTYSPLSPQLSLLSQVHRERAATSRTYSPLSPQLSLLSQVHRERAATSRTYEGASALGKATPSTK